MYGSLLKYYLEQRHWERLSVDEVRHRQTAKFRQLFEFARVHSPFYRKIYTEAGVEKLQIHTFDDIQKVPVVDKAMMRAYMTEEIMTRPITDDLILNTTGGSTGGDPFKIYQTRYEQYTAHLRVFSMLTELGYRPWHLILILWRLEPNAVLAVERDLRLLPRLRESFKFFRREILSVHARPEAIVSWVQARPDAKIFWATPGMLSILCDHLEAREINFHFKRTILSAETLFPAERKRFAPRMGGPVVSQYGMAECPSIGYDTGLDDRTRIFANACMLELLNLKDSNSARHGEVVITNLVNSTMPFIRYNTRDSAMALNDHECPARMIGPIRGRLDDVLTLPGGGRVAHHQAFDMFKDFDECSQYKLVQTRAGETILRLTPRALTDQSLVREKALARWKQRYPSERLQIEFVETMPLDPTSGKFKIIEPLAKLGLQG